MHLAEIVWAGGLFEGEGCFYYSARSGYRSAQISMTDEEPLRRFHEAVVGVGKLRGPYERNLPRKEVWVWSATTFEEVQAVAAMLWPYLSERRRAAARAVILPPARPLGRPKRKEK
jgi:hypothetical protein